jgi:mitochondrial import receptor subunit TOM40
MGLLPFLKKDLPNPGRLEELKREAQGILSPDIFDGARFEFNKTLTQKFALLHNVFLGSAGQPGSYEFGANFGDERVLLASRIDMGGRLNGRMNAQVSDSTLVRLQAQVGPDGGNNSFKADVDYKGSDFTASGYFMGGGLLGVHYMQSVTDGLALGAEGFYHSQNSKVRGGAGAARLVWGGKGENVATCKVGTFGHGAVELAYSRKVRCRPSPRRRTGHSAGTRCMRHSGGGGASWWVGCGCARGVTRVDEGSRLC